MRIEFIYENSNRESLWQHRERCAQLICEAFNKNAPLIYQRLSKIMDGVEPFTFYITQYREKIINREDSEKLFSRLIFSSFSPEICAAVYNGLIELYKINKLNLLNTYLHPFITIDKEIAVFKTLSPAILDVTDPDWYLKEDHNELLEKINLYVKKLTSYFLRNEMTIERLNFSQIARLAIKYNDNIIQGIEGIFEIQAPVEVLNLLYNAGLGTYRRKGFGMLELVKVGNL